MNKKEYKDVKRKITEVTYKSDISTKMLGSLSVLYNDLNLSSQTYIEISEKLKEIISNLKKVLEGLLKEVPE